jgi:hypothetical protein
MKWEDLSWPIRTGLSCAVSSLVYLSPVDERANGILEGRLLAPITASICSLSVLGQTVRSGMRLYRRALCDALSTRRPFSFALATLCCLQREDAYTARHQSAVHTCIYKKTKHVQLSLSLSLSLSLCMYVCLSSFMHYCPFQSP